MHEHRIFDASSLRPIHVRGNAHRLGKIRQPQGEIHQRISIFQKRSAAGLRLAAAPSLLRRSKLVLAGAHSHHASELTTFKKTPELLHIAAKPVVVSDDNFPVSGFSSGENSIHTTRCQRKRSL